MSGHLWTLSLISPNSFLRKAFPGSRALKNGSYFMMQMTLTLMDKKMAGMVQNKLHQEPKKNTQKLATMA